MNGEPAYPLEHLKVLDFSRVLAGPFASRMLSELGADVVKIEPPEGDVTRVWGRVVGGLPGFFNQQNLGKRCMSIDLNAPGARELVLSLVRTADVVIENFRSDVMPRFGLGYDDLRAVNPRIIMLSISGFGAGGPESHRPAYAPVVHAEVGLIGRSARRRGVPAVDLPLSVADTNAGLHGLVGLLAAVIKRDRTGEGDHIDIAMIDATVATDDQLHLELEDSEDTGPLLNEVWDTAAGPILISSDFRLLWTLLRKEWEVEDPTRDDMSRDERIAARRAAVTAFLAGLTSWDRVEEVMSRMNVAWGQVRRGASIMDHPTVRHRGVIVQIDDRAGGTRPVTRSPYRFANARSGPKGPAGHRGEHNREVLAEWLHMEADAIAALEAEGVLVRDETLVP
jgi:crotonobetainyl-CoA:carnitine CoA-transferase CaiB-like acyl-CoA transferase